MMGKEMKMFMEKIFLISGKAQHGKNTLGSMLFDHYRSIGKTIIEMAYGDYVKYIAKTYYQWNGEKNDYGRHLLQRIGTDIGRKQNPYIWVDRILEDITIIKEDYDIIILTDCRFPNEIDTLKEEFPVESYAIRINRIGFESELTEEQNQHPSETMLDNYEFDYCLESKGGLDELELEVVKMLGILDNQ